MTARNTNTPRENTPTEQNKEDNSLILYRLLAVESAVKDVAMKIELQDNLKRSDLKDFQAVIIERFSEMRVDLQKQIDDKADSGDLNDLKKLIYAVGSVIGAIVSGVAIVYITSLKK